jgi:hypothetical protein
VSDIGVHNRSDRLVLEVLDDVVPEETPTSDDAEADPGVVQCRHDLLPIDIDVRVQDDRE